MKRILLPIFFLLVFVKFASATPVAVPEDKKIDVSISSVSGQLVIIASENILQVDIYSAIGGHLYSTKVNYNEVRIDNLPKTYLVVRIKFYNNKTSIYKIKND